MFLSVPVRPLVGFAIVVSLPVSVSAQEPNPGVASRISGLEERVQALEDRMTFAGQQLLAQRNRIVALESASRHRHIPVDCAAGQSINGALAQAIGPGPITISVSGTCVETATVFRDDVAIAGTAAGDGIRAPGADVPALSMIGQRLSVRNLRLEGGMGLVVGHGGSVGASGIIVTGAQTGLNVTFNATLTVNDSVIEESQSGALVGRDSFLSVGATIFRNNAAGVSAIGSRVQLVRGVVIQGPLGGRGLNAIGSHVFASDTSIDGYEFGVMLDASSLQLGRGTITNSRIGAIHLSNRSSVDIADSVIENNGAGINATGGSSIVLGAATIRGNYGDGVRLADVSVIAKRDGPTPPVITQNGGWGLVCAPAPALPQISEASIDQQHVFGNQAGQVDCPGALIR